MAWDWIYWLLLVLLSAVGLALAVIGLPGIWLIVVAAGLYAWATGAAHIGVWGVVTLLLIGVAAEIAETALGGVAAARAGGSRRGMFGAIAGGLVGAIAGTPLIPIPVVGTLIGAVLGSFVGAFVVEAAWVRQSVGQSARIGVGAAKGRVYGMVVKLAFGGVMALVALAWALPLHGRNTAPRATPGPATLPLPTTPATTSAATRP